MVSVTLEQRAPKDRHQRRRHHELGEVAQGRGAELAALIPGAKLLDIPDRDHMFAVGDKVFKQGVLEFLKQRP
mgnify:CR=1 FL=1